MYLKSLVLKGFKSFADKSVLTLQPGITAIVGPNGSGKSNISDAVLWVLGERSARNLRGQAMEDIIFSGSAARKAVSVAEVELVLDNSDHVIPVDYDEVVVTRRMYRSGESEYLVNGVVVRRLDVLDILHDSGLGTGTHSIISQGSLDSILQSKPEDRRALIEEAAGVLKHKRRKQKSARKIEQMDNHLNRVRDVTAEVARQLGPLERKAKRAEAYMVAREELHDVKLAIAVDDLRRLQDEWERVCADEKTVAGYVDSKRLEVQEAERKVNDYQEIIRRESEGASELSRYQRRASSLSERLDSAERLVRERKRAQVDSMATMTESLQEASEHRSTALEELASAREQLAEARGQGEAAEAYVRESMRERDDIAEKLRLLETELSDCTRDLAKCETAWEVAKNRHANAQRMLSDSVAQVKLHETRASELESELRTARDECEAARRVTDAAKAALDEAQNREAALQEALVARFEERDKAHASRDTAVQDVLVAEAEASAIERALAAIRDDDPALSWVARHAERFGGRMTAISKTFKVKRGLEALVESLLGHDLAALAVDDAGCAQKIATALDDEGVSGMMAMVMRDDEAAMRAARGNDAPGCHALLEDLEYSDEMKPIVESLLGDVMVCEDRSTAFAAHAAGARGARFLSLDGCVVWPSGKVYVLGPDVAGGEGVIARERRLGELKDAAVRLAKQRDIAVEAAEAADRAYREAQAAALESSQQLANCKGAYEAAIAEQVRSERRVEVLEQSIAEVKRKIESTGREVEELRPSLEIAYDEVEELSRRREALTVESESKVAAIAPLRKESAQASERYSEARLKAVQLAERRTYAKRIVEARERDLQAIDRQADNACAVLAVKRVGERRAAATIGIIAQLADSLGQRVKTLDEALRVQESSTSSVHADAAAARDEARRAHGDYDSASERMAQVRVEKSRLEMRVEAAVNVITVELKTPLDQAQKLAELEDRQKAEAELLRLERKIKNMGAINPDAAEEYAQIKQRYDFLAGQLADMESAKKSLVRISKVIDRRMRDDFVSTFEKVNANFGEVFGELFPGGSAHLSFDNPDDVENTGVEVTAQPAGKRLTKMMLMSGGEKSLTALALLFAVYKTRATPFYILDEVEAALDDTNLRRLAGYIDTLRDSTQLIMITHQRRTMEMADVLFGVSMHSDGVTKVVSQKLERALENVE